MFATKENIFVVASESMNGNENNLQDLTSSVYGIVFNGTHFEGDKPERNGDHDFTGAPTYEEVIENSQQLFTDEILGDESLISIVAATLVLITIVPTLILSIVAIILIFKYSKNKKILKRYEQTYGNIPQYNTYPQNYGGYGYNQPVNQPYQPYQPPVNTAYQQNPANQNVPQTPSYVTNAVNNLENAQPTQPAQENITPETQENKIDNENKI